MALTQRGMLTRYVTGVPTRRNVGGRFGNRLWGRKAAAYAIAIDPALVQHIFIAPLVRRTARIFGTRWSAPAAYVADGLFDRYACGLVRSLKPDVVVAYENSALHIFRRAKELGVTTVLDAASLHHRWQDRIVRPTEGNWLHRQINQRKDEEIRLADCVLTVSEFARESYLDAGLSIDRVHAVTVGVDSQRFRSSLPAKTEAFRRRPIRFVYIGNGSPLKGVEVLREAVRCLKVTGEEFKTTLIGLSAKSHADDFGDGIVNKGWMNHDQLVRELSEHDVLVLPSFFDSFGMVVAEAMACGLPAIVTHNVGARELITPGVNGQVIAPGDANGLADAMRWFIDRRHELPQMGKSARESAERYDWSNYRHRVTDILAAIGSLRISRNEREPR